MAEEFRQRVIHDWRMHRMWEAIHDYAKAVDEAWGTFDALQARMEQKEQNDS